MSDLTIPASMRAPALERRSGVALAAQTALLALLTVLYGGGFLFLATISPMLLYSFYGALAGLVALRMATPGQAWGDLRPVALYLGWLVAFWAWGVLVSPFPAWVLPEVVRIVFRNVLFLCAAAMALSDTRGLRQLAVMVQAAIFVNLYVALRQLNDPAFAVDFAGRLGDEAYVANNVRPGGLWINPDEAAFALLMGLLLLARERGPLVWAARAAAVYGIYLSASRSGNYMLALSGLVYLLFKLRQGVLSFGRATVLVNLLALAYGVWLALFLTGSLPRYDASQDFALSRILDFREENAELTRGDLTGAVFAIALDTPWHGHGAMALQDNVAVERYFERALPGLGAHNIYLAVWGEAGLMGMAAYLAVLAAAAGQVLRLPMRPHFRLVAGLMWLAYLIRGLTWHGQMFSGSGIVLIGIILCYPRLAALASAEEGAR